VDKILFTWSDFDVAVTNIVARLRAKGIVEKIDVIYGIPRGGLVLAVVLSHRLDRPLTADFPRAFDEAMSGKRLLMVDDISDTGRTLKRFAAALGACTATIHFVKGSVFEPDVWVCERPRDAWVVYPWEVSK